MKIQEVLTKTTQFFKEKKIESARLDAELLISKALGLRRIDLYMKFEQALKEEEVVQCREFVRRRAAGEPVAYILNEKGFFGLDFFVDKRVLIPRPESEMLVELSLDYLQTRRPKARKANKSAGFTIADRAAPETRAEVLATAQALAAGLVDVDSGMPVMLAPVTISDVPEVFHIMDLGCGSGCLALAMLSQRYDVRATLVDRSPLALEVAKLNAEKIGLFERCEWFEGRVQDLTLETGVDVILANPPYIRKGDPALQRSVEVFEPALALFGGDSGMEEIEQWLPQCRQWLKVGGLLVMEIGADQAAVTLAEFQKNNFVECEIKKDLAGLDRVVMGRKG